MRLKKLILLLFAVSSYSAQSQEKQKKIHFTVVNASTQVEKTQIEKAAFRYYQFSELRFLQQKRSINIQNSTAKIILYSANDLWEKYGKPISPLTIDSSIEHPEIEFSLTDSKTPELVKHIIK